MHPDLTHLVALDRLDRAVDRSHRQTREAREALAAAERDLDEANRHADALQRQLAASRDQQHQAERQAKRYRDRTRSAQQVLDRGVGDFGAAERQIAECQRILDELETTILEQMDLQDELARRLSTAQAEIARAEQELAEARDRTPGVLQAESARRAELEAERTTHLEALDPEIASRYRRLVERKRRAVAPVDRQSCAACMHALKPQQRIELTRDRLVSCDSCHRWLYLPEPD